MPAPSPGQSQAAVEMTVRMPDPGRALVEGRFAPGAPFDDAAAFRRLRPDAGSHWAADAPVLRPLEDGGLGFRELAVADADGWVRIGVPLPASPGPPGADLSFRALIHPPPGYRLVDPFPSRIEELEGGTLRLELPAPPSLVRFRVVATDSRRLTAAQFADLAVGLALAALAGFGFVRLRRQAPEA